VLAHNLLQGALSPEEGGSFSKGAAGSCTVFTSGPACIPNKTELVADWPCEAQKLVESR